MSERKRILLVEDDENLAFVVKDNLLDRGFDVIHVADGAAAVSRFSEERIDLVLLDIMLPRQDGFSVAGHIRQKDSTTPIIFLTAKDFKDDRLRGFQLGADDYVTKPFILEELIYRIEAVLRRTAEPVSPGGEVLTFGRFVFEPATLTLRIDGQSFTLTRKEAALLQELARNKDRVVERSILLKKVWGKDGYFVGRSMDVYMTKVRKYLREDPNVEIVNIHGVGFKLTDRPESR